MLKPTDLGLPQKFSDWRSEQYRAFVGAAGCDKFAYLIDAPTGIGKCLGKDTPVLMYNGSIKPVQDIFAGDTLMGPDGLPRTVIATSTGVGDLYRILPRHGDPFIINSEHTLSLKMTSMGEKRSAASRLGKRWKDVLAGSVVDIEWMDYVGQNSFFKHVAKLYRVPIDFPPGAVLPLDPYFLGVWLGDGTSHWTQLINADSEVLDYVSKYVHDNFPGLLVNVKKHHTANAMVLNITSGLRGGDPLHKIGRNPMLLALENLGIRDNKHVPLIYKTASREDRRRLLAGIVDTDGGLCGDHVCYEVAFASRVLAEDTAFIARSLGLCATIAHDVNENYNRHRVVISGETSAIPVIIPRKKASERKQIKDPLKTGFGWEYVGVGEYYGFELDGDGRFLLSDFTVTHNSLVGAAIQKLHGKTHVYLVNTKQLQDQILKDFPYAKTMKGRVNYPCARFPKQFPEVTANDCTSTTNFPCELREACPYIRAKMVALHAELAVLNYTYFLYECNFVGGEDRQSFSNIGPVICDEVDALEDELMSYTSLTVTAKQLEHLGIEPPRYKTKFESWRDWANPSLDKVAHSIEELESTVCNPSGWGVYDTSAMRKLSAFRRLAGKLDFFIREVNDTWVWYPGEDLWEFKPVWISKYADGVMWRHVPRMYGMSATILDPRQLDRNIGLTNVNLNRYYDYICMSSPFSKECRPVYYQPVANITNKTLKDEIPKLLRAIDSILSKHSGDKVLIHTVSYQIAKYILDNSSYRKRLRSHNTFNRAQVLDEFKRSNYPLVLVSPSMDRGVDLPNDECRAVIIAKVPFPYLGDPQIAKRLYSSKDGRQWYAHRTVSTIIQMAGRGVRSVDDYASCVAPDTKILTSELRWVLASHLKENEGVLCFDEQPIGLGKKNTRYWRRGIVLATGLRAIPCYKLTLADNTVLICTYNHKWLVRRLNSSVWEETKNLTVGSELLRYIRPWVTGTSYTHGWVSGFADGEGTYSAGLGKRNPNVNHIVISQNEGPELDNLRRALGELSFAYSCTPNGTGVHLYVNGGLEEKLRFLGEIRPGRLLRKFYDSNFSSMLRAMDTVNVECIEYIGSQEVVTLQVDRGTYFAEGFGAHNTYILDEQFGRLYSENRRLFPSWFAEAIVE